MPNEYIQRQLTSGEVLLIDTRQHWVALLRFAIRPLLIIGVAILLSILNQWLKFERLGFINDIVHWVILILFVAAIVWLPIDVVRWWSRHYVLTNRRAMRMDGVLRRQSFDSSLEQINDIMLSQSFLGRQLGYADLRLLTANSSNEAYERLLDGPQFKRAVLDAKEAIRSGRPLQALPEGFVVRGGTNEASMRAASRSTPAPVAETVAESAPPAAAAGSVAMAGTAAALSAATPVVTPETEDAPPMDAPSLAEATAEDEAFGAWPPAVQTDSPIEPATILESEAAETAASPAQEPVVDATSGSDAGTDPSWDGDAAPANGDGGTTA